jgi:hypothetical protein
VKQSYDTFSKMKIMHMIEKLQLIKKSRYESFFSHNLEERPSYLKNIPDSIIGKYLEPKYQKIEKVENFKGKEKVANSHRGPIEVLYTREKTLLTSVSQSTIPSSPIMKKITREYLMTENKLSRNNVYDPYANNSLRRRSLIRDYNSNNEFFN